MNLRSSRGLLPVACAAALALVALRAGAAQQLTFRSAIRTVVVYATVSDREGRLVPNLEKDKFRVLDDGRPVDITVFSNAAQPMDRKDWLPSLRFLLADCLLNPLLQLPI